jgi:hypothetical protein
MRLRGFRISVALLVFLGVFVLGMGAQYLHQRTQVISPLVERLLEIPGVLDVSVEKGLFRTGSRTLVILEVEQESSLGLTFGPVYETLAEAGGEYAVYIQDSPNLELLRLFQDIQVAVEEAVMTGEFTRLGERVEEFASEEGVTWELGVDRQFIYLTLSEGENTLRRVISRDRQEGSISVRGNGGAVS